MGEPSPDGPPRPRDGRAPFSGEGGTDVAPIAVTGAAGRIGQAVVSALAAQGLDVVGVTRRPVEPPPGAAARIADYDDPTALRSAFAGTATVVLVSSDGPAELVLQHHLNLIDAARAAAVRHVVVLSSVDADARSPFCYARVNALTEAAVRASGVGHTIVQASIFTEFLASLCALVMVHGEVRLPAADGRVGLVARADVARCLAACARRDPAGHTFVVTGPDALDLTEVATLLRMTYTPVSEAEFLRQLAGSESPWWSYAYASMLASVREHRWNLTTDVVRALTGAPALPPAAVLLAGL